MRLEGTLIMPRWRGNGEGTVAFAVVDIGKCTDAVLGVDYGRVVLSSCCVIMI